MVAEVNERGGRRMEDEAEALEPPWWGQALRRVLVRAFHTLGRCHFDLHVRGLEHFTNQPGTLIVSNHKSDYDLILLAPLLDRAHRGRGPSGRTAFVAAEQMFHASYVSGYLLANGPEPVRRLVRRADLSPILRALRAHPVPASRHRRLAIHLREVRMLEGDPTLEEIFRVPPQRLFPGVPTGSRLSDALAWRYNRELYTQHDVSIFRSSLASKLRRRQAREAQRSLRRFASILDAGDSLFLAPEGGLTADGSFREIKAGLGRLVRTAGREPRLLPVHITYDTRTTGRPAAFVNIGREMVGARSWPRGRLESTLRRTMRSLSTITLPELAASDSAGGCGVAVPEDASALARNRVFASAWRLARGGRCVDPRLLDPDSFVRCWSRFVNHSRWRRRFGPTTGPAAGESPGWAPPGGEAETAPPLVPAEDFETPLIQPAPESSSLESGRAAG